MTGWKKSPCDVRLSLASESAHSHELSHFPGTVLWEGLDD